MGTCMTIVKLMIIRQICVCCICICVIVCRVLLCVCSGEAYILKAKKFAEPPFQSKKMRKKCINPGVIFGPFGVILGHFGSFLGHFGSFLDKFAESSNLFAE